MFDRMRAYAVVRGFRPVSHMEIWDIVTVWPTLEAATADLGPARDREYDGDHYEWKLLEVDRLTLPGEPGLSLISSQQLRPGYVATTVCVGTKACAVSVKASMPQAILGLLFAVIQKNLILNRHVDDLPTEGYVRLPQFLMDFYDRLPERPCTSETRRLVAEWQDVTVRFDELYNRVWHWWKTWAPNEFLQLASVPPDDLYNSYGFLIVTDDDARQVQSVWSNEAAAKAALAADHSARPHHPLELRIEMGDIYWAANSAASVLVLRQIGEEMVCDVKIVDLNIQPGRPAVQHGSTARGRTADEAVRRIMPELIQASRTPCPWMGCHMTVALLMLQSLGRYIPPVSIRELHEYMRLHSRAGIVADSALRALIQYEGYQPDPGIYKPK